MDRKAKALHRGATPMTNDPKGRDAVLNSRCFCITLDQEKLDAAIRSSAMPDLSQLLNERKSLFSSSPVFLAKADLDAMLDVVLAIEAAAASPQYQRAVLAWAPPIASGDFGPLGVFMGYDFHLGDDGPRLIEVNTNAGGAFLNAVLAQAQRACCREAQEAVSGPADGGFEDAVWEMFLAEWRRQGRAGQPRTIAIVDDCPQEQYLLPEFLLAQGLFERHGVQAWIADPSELSFTDGALRRGGDVVDLVYNRLVDFSLAAPGHEPLQAAYQAGAVVLTPNPHNHALYADKRNLVLLSDPGAVGDWGLTPAQQRSLSSIPRTVPVTRETADQLWADRKRYFFKPDGGHGGKAVYRGDKTTRGVWELIRKGCYIAQELAQPSTRSIAVDGEIQSMKLDVRLYTYAGTVLLAAARIYQGQTTNFRTPGGGFAPVFVV